MDRFFALLKSHIPRGVFLFFQPAYHFALAFSAALFYGFPSRRLFVIGVTGTKGKTTVVELLHEILRGVGEGVASLSSLRFKLGEAEVKNEKKMTMPGRFFVQQFLHEARKKRYKYVVLEVTSEGIKQFRHRFIRFQMAVMTNVAPEHIESHGSFERYLRAKLDLFYRLSKGGVVVINRDDPHADRFAAATPAHRVWYGKEEIRVNDNALPISQVDLAEKRIKFNLNGTLFSSHLQGEFNFYNILAAVGAAEALHLDRSMVARAIERVQMIPGRLEYAAKEPFRVVVDYAHTPDSLRAVYKTLRQRNQEPETGNQKLICVLGACGGGRDKWKRPEIGKIAAEYCDEIILTDEDPYDENPSQILSEIESGIFDPRSPISKILERRAAIRHALELAKPGDTVIITGKGAEPLMMGPNGLKIPWDDREVVRSELKTIHEYH